MHPQSLALNLLDGYNTARAAGRPVTPAEKAVLVKAMKAYATHLAFSMRLTRVGVMRDKAQAKTECAYARKAERSEFVQGILNSIQKKTEARLGNAIQLSQLQELILTIESAE